MAYLIPAATTNSYGMVMIGNNISVSNGVISTTGGGGGNSTIGTWTPSITSSAANANITLTVASARYVKTGQQVECYYDFTISTETGGNNNGTLTLNGLPFASISGNGIVGSLTTTYFDSLNTNQTYITGTISGATTTVILWCVHQAVTMTELTQNDIKATTRLAGTVSYISAS